MKNDLLLLGKGLVDYSSSEDDVQPDMQNTKAQETTRGIQLFFFFNATGGAGGS